MPIADAYPHSFSRPDDQSQTARDPNGLHELLTVEEVAALLKVSPS